MPLQSTKMAQQQQNKRALMPSCDSIGASKMSKAPAASNCPVSGGAAAVEDTSGPLELPRVTISPQRRLFHCAVAECDRPLKPPVFKCEAGHRQCRDCRGDAGEGHCRRCGRNTTFVHCGPEVDEYVGGFKVSCPFESYGCGDAVAYHDAAAHRDACEYAPSSCAVAGCAFAGSSPMLRDHLAAVHSWPVHALPGYGKSILLDVPSSGPAHRLLVVDGDERRLFVMSVRPRGASCWAVTVACVRASGAAAAGPWYEYNLFVYGAVTPGHKGDFLMMMAAVASCSVPGGAADEEGMATLVPALMLCGPSKEIRLHVSINMVNPAPAAPLPAVH